jgi:hypothetical protein
VPVLGTGVAPVEQVHVEALPQEEFNKAVARHQVQNVGTKDGRVDEQDRYRILLLAGRLVVKELGLTPLPDYLLRGEACLDFYSVDDEVGASGVLSEADRLRVVVIRDLERYRSSPAVGHLVLSSSLCLLYPPIEETKTVELFEALELLLGWPYAPGEVAHASQAP